MKGSQAGALISYLFGPGKANIHSDQHLVASWDGDAAGRQPARGQDGRFDTAALTKALNLPLAKLGIAGADKTVWHCAVSIHKDDGHLSDDQWREVAEEVMAAAGLAGTDETAGVRWVAVRHGLSANGNDHIHIAATLAAEDGSKRLRPRSHDFKAIGQACRELEVRFGLQHRTRPRDSTAAQVRSSRAEDERAARAGRVLGPGESRFAMAESVRAAAVASSNLASFEQQLHREGILLRPVRPSDTQPGRYLGFTFADPAMTPPGREHQWISGSALGKDLSAPRIYARWDAANRALDERLGLADTAQRAADALSSARPGEAEGTAWLAGDLLGAYARNPNLPPEVRQVLKDAAQHAARAASPLDRRPPVLDQSIHTNLRWGAITMAARTQMKDKSSRDNLTALLQLDKLAKSLQAYREQQHRYHQADNARRVRQALAQARQVSQAQARQAATHTTTTTSTRITPGPTQHPTQPPQRGPIR